MPLDFQSGRNRFLSGWHKRKLIWRSENPPPINWHKFLFETYKILYVNELVIALTNIVIGTIIGRIFKVIWLCVEKAQNSLGIRDTAIENIFYSCAICVIIIIMTQPCSVPTMDILGFVVLDLPVLSYTPDPQQNPYIFNFQ